MSNKNKINDLDMSNWKQYDETIITDSLWLIDKRDNTGAHHAGYHGLFVPQIPHQAILRYTKQDDTVLDPFLGSGTTLIECKRLGRNGIGFDLNIDVAREAVKTIEQESNPFNVYTKVFKANAIEKDSYDYLYNYHAGKDLDLIILHPPYHDIIKFSSDPNDLSNCHDVNEFLDKMKKVFVNCYNVLKTGHYMVLVIGDYYTNSQHVPLSYMCMQEALNVGFKLKSHVVKDIQNNRGKANQYNLWRYRALIGGFYIFKHENIFFFFK